MNVVDKARRMARSGHDFLRDNAVLLFGLFMLQAVVYSHLFTSVIFTNHTFPNAFVYPYPSFKTLGEGRWLADIIIWLQGGSGVRPYQMVLATLLQGFNGLLFARFMGLTRRVETAIVAAVLCLYPAFLDYYSFEIDHLTFVLGDTFVLVGVLFCARRAPSPRAGLVTCALFVLALAAHQPKLALLCLLSLCLLARRIASASPDEPFDAGEALRWLGYITLILTGAVVVYFLTTRATILYDIGMRSRINSVPEILSQTAESWSVFFAYFTTGVDYLPTWLRFLPAACILLGVSVLLVGAWRCGTVALTLMALTLALVPLALRAPHVVNSNTWEVAGRITFAYGYALLFFACCALGAEALKKLVTGMLALLLYFFVIVATQESNAAAFKGLYDLEMINRITARVERAVPGRYEHKRALVVFGRYPEFDRARFVRYPNGAPYRAHLQSHAFEFYREVDILNFFLGSDVFRCPTPEEVERAGESARGRPAWPHQDAVYEADGAVVVLLEAYGPEVVHTCGQGRPSPPRPQPL